MNLFQGLYPVLSLRFICKALLTTFPNICPPFKVIVHFFLFNETSLVNILRDEGDCISNHSTYSPASKCYRYNSFSLTFRSTEFKSIFCIFLYDNYYTTIENRMTLLIGFSYFLLHDSINNHKVNCKRVLLIKSILKFGNKQISLLLYDEMI